MSKNKLLQVLLWIIFVFLGTIGISIIALNRGEPINAIWIIVVALSVYFIGYRFYSKFIASKVLELNDANSTPAVKINDGLDYVPTNKVVLFGHHFAAIAGAGPLVGPVLASQMGYLPSMLWILAGVILAGAVQDFLILVISTRNKASSLGEMIKQELGPVAGCIALLGTMAIMVILLAVLSLVVVKALADSPWGMFTIMATIPIAIFMGLYSRYIRVGKVLEVSVLGVTLLMLALFAGQYVAEHKELSVMFTFSPVQITWMMIGYGFIAAVLPVWLILAPRDYLSTFLKIGVIVALAISILIVMPNLKMPAVTKFIDGSGPVWSGSLFPFLFITIACGAISGFHSLIASGTTPKLLEKESQARFIGYGAMLMESFVAIMALVAASCIDPGVYFAMNSPPAVIGKTVESASIAITNLGFTITPQELQQVATDIGEKSILSRAGGAPTLAVGIAQIFSQLIGGKTLMAFWYHFAILFEALFILTAIDAGTRAGRFMLQDLLGLAVPKLKNTQSVIGNLLATALCVSAWGWFLYQGVTDPLGGINSLWPLFGISNQMLAVIALIFSTTMLFKMKKKKYIWVTMLPLSFVMLCTLTAAYQKITHINPKIGFLANAEKYKNAILRQEIIAPAKSIEQMQQIVFNNYVNSALSIFFMAVVLSILFCAIIKCLKICVDQKEY